MTNAPKSCAVAFPSQRNCATSENSATPNATHYAQTNGKPASIRELRAQLQAQQERNKAATIHATEAAKVAHEIVPVAELQSCVPYAAKSATDLAREFMEVDDLSLVDAQALAAVSVLPRPPAEWMALIQELDSLLDRYCRFCRLSDAARDRIREIRKKQSLASIPLAVDWLRQELSAWQDS